MSPWDGASRAPLRVLLGLLMAVDTILCAYFLSSLRPSALSHPHAPGWLLALGSNPPALAALAALGVVASLLFARRPGAWLAGTISLVCAGVLVEAQGALLEGPMRFLFFSGTCLFGWLFGLAFARWLKVDDARAERLAEQGAVSALAAGYVGALISKLAAAGIGWPIHGGLRADIAGQHVWGRSAILDALTLLVLDHAFLAYALGVFTFLAQASAVLMPYSRRGRMLAGVLLLLFHAGVWLLTPIVFPQAMLLVLTFAFPWPRWLQRNPSPVEPIPASRPAVLRALAAAALLVAIAWLPSLRAYTQLRHFRSPSGGAPSAATRALLGDLIEGASVAGFRVERIEESNAIQLFLTRGHDSLVVELARAGSRPFRPRETAAGFDLFYQQSSVTDDTAAEILHAVALRLRPGHRL